MTVAGVVLATEALPTGARRRSGRSRTDQLARAALGAGLDEVVVVVNEVSMADRVPPDATVLCDEGGSEASALRAAVDWCARLGHEAIVLATSDPPSPGADLATEPRAWRALARSGESLAVATALGRRAPLVRIGEDRWPLLPLEGRVLTALDHRCGTFAEVEVRSDQAQPTDSQPADSQPTDSQPADSQPADSQPPLPGGDHGSGPGASFALEGDLPTASDVAAVTELLGRPPSGRFRVAVRDADGSPVVIENAPFLDDKTPMPTRYWLVGRREREAVGRLESTGGVRSLERRFSADELDALHERYARERDALIDPAYRGPRPTGGVGGTRRGLKCLHAHLAWYLAGGHDPVGRWVALQLGRELSGPVAAIDCGTNSTRLLIIDRHQRALRREMTITRLGEGVDETGRLSPVAISRTIDVLARYRAWCDDAGVVALRAATTSAARDASNQPELFARAKEVLGVELELLSGREEGELSYAGATRGLPEDGPFLVVDVGGGSTEFAAGAPDAPRELADVVSVDMGCVRLTERFLHEDPPARSELETARAYVADRVAALRTTHPAMGVPSRLIGVAGTVATLATRSLGRSEYDGTAVHGSRIGRAFVESELAMLAERSVAQRRKLGGIENARADVIVGGLVVVAEVMAQFGFDELWYSEHDILDGLAASLIEQRPGETKLPTSIDSASFR